MLMDLYPVLLGDTVYDMQYGPGTVVELLSNAFIVGYSTGRRYTYAPTGVMNGRQFRTLFWKPPIIAVPMKDDPTWVRVTAICEAVVTAMRS